MSSKAYDNKILFVREQGTSNERSRARKRNLLGVNFDGEEAKAFYEVVLGTEPQVQARKKRIKVVVSNKEKEGVKRKTTKSAFQLAESNDVAGLREVLECGIDINKTDDYGWSALMCAACGGCDAAVQYLLLKGADASIRDKAGHNALTLAKRNGHIRVVKTLEDHKYSIDKFTSETSVAAVSHQKTFCELCKDSYSCNRKKHETSTAHLLKKNESVKTRTFYGIPESNKGFQLLMQQGWNRDHGLGPEGSGRKFPIRVKSKPDRLGIGAEVSRKKVDGDGLTLSVTSKKDEKRLERNFRLEFY